MRKIEVVLMMTEELLGTASANPDLYAEHIGKNHPQPEAVKDEVETLPDVEETLQKSTTVFHRTEDGQPMIYDYQIKGFFKDACGMLRRTDDKEYDSKKLKAFKKEIDGLIFVEPREIVLDLPEGTELAICERPLRASTPQGERVALSRSEAAPAGTTLRFTVVLLADRLAGLVEEWLNYGAYRGLGQWRNSGKGRYSWKELNG